MYIEKGYVYHIKDEYFDKVKDDKLMINKEKGNNSPTFYCYEDKKTGLIWVVPMSKLKPKHLDIYNKCIAKYGECLQIVIGNYDGSESAYLLQNMFPITKDYLHHIHTRNGNPVPVSPKLQVLIESNLVQLRILVRKGAKVVFPDIQRLEKIMLEELHQTKGIELNQNNKSR